MIFRRFPRPVLRRAAVAGLSPSFSTSSEIIFTMTDVEKTAAAKDKLNKILKMSREELDALVVELLQCAHPISEPSKSCC